MIVLKKIAVLIILGSCCIGAEYGNITKIPDDFDIGVSSSAYQIEGGWNVDGKGQSFFDNFFHRNPNGTVDGKNGDVACDSYHKWREDVENIKNLGVKHYRFSIAWSRILPNGTADQVDEKGVNYYLKLIKALLKNGIEPRVTMFHYDLPLAVHMDGGWLNPKIVDYFGNYSRVIYQRFGKYVKHWFTQNEPKEICKQGVGFGTKPYALGEAVYICMRHTILAHARAWHIYSNEFRSKQKGKISVVLNSEFYFPSDPNNSTDVQAVERQHQFEIDWFPNVVYKEDWPPLMKKRVAERSALEGYNQSRLPEWSAKEIAYVKGTIDFFSMNYYTSFKLQDAPEFESTLSPNITIDERIITYSDPSWTCDIFCNYAPGLPGYVKRIHDQYHPNEIFISENGWGDSGGLDDPLRIDYIRDHLRALIYLKIYQNIPISGYTVWSWMDNFEWANSYTVKFGLHNVDFDSPNRTRTIKKSGNWFQNLTATRIVN